MSDRTTATNSRLARARMAWRIASVRLRFPIVLVAAFVVVGRWDVLRNYWDKLAGSTAGGGALQAVSGDTEYFCPMDPGVLSDWPGKCSICNMALVRRKRGEAVPLPDGVVARMQFSPYRVQLAGIQTSPISYRPLEREVEVEGLVRPDGRRAALLVAPADGLVIDVAREAVVEEGGLIVKLRVRDLEGQDEYREVELASPVSGNVVWLDARPGRRVEAGSTLGEVADLATVCVESELASDDLASIVEGQTASATCRALPGHAPFAARVRRLLPAEAADRLPRVELEVDNPLRELRPGVAVVAKVRVPIAGLEPFRSMPTGLPALIPGEPRAVFACPDHPETTLLKAGRCPRDRNELERRDLAENQRVRWWCPMHPEVTDDRPGRQCSACGGMTLVPRVIAYSPPGQVLAIPESAIVDTGTRKVAFVERMPGMFDGVEVALGPRCGSSFPVVRGLDAGDRVATAGAFLIDAETRLNPSVAASYFGAARSPTTSATPRTPETTGPAPEDRTIVARQQTCPVTGKPLGSMGTPVRVVVAGKPLFLCCAGCEPRLRQSPEEYLSKLPAGAERPAHPP